MKRKLILLIPVLFLMLNLAGARIIEVPEAVGGVAIICGGVGAADTCVTDTVYGHSNFVSTSQLGTNASLTTGPITVGCTRNGTFDARIYISNTTTAGVSFGVYLDDGDNVPDSGDSLLCSIATWTIDVGALNDYTENSEGLSCDLSENDVIFILVATSPTGILNTGRDGGADGSRWYKTSAGYYDNLPANLGDIGSETSTEEYNFVIQVP